MYKSDDPLLTLDDINAAKNVVDASPYTIRTPLLKATGMFDKIDPSINLYLKLENMQNTGSFKVRGIINQLHCLPEGCGTEGRKLISMSAGNYGRAYAEMCKLMDLKAKLLMPETAPANRAALIQSYGVDVERMPTNELQRKVDQYVKQEKMVYLHPFDDIKLIAGHASCALEILEDLPHPDVVLICCGGGGLVAGSSTAIKLSGCHDCRVYAVEPERARTMFESFKQGRPISMFPKSLAAGLSPPFAGANCYKHCQTYAEGVLLVSDEEIVRAVRELFRRGLVVEPSGAAAFAALLHGKVPDVKGKNVVVVVTGGNVTVPELVDLDAKFPEVRIMHKK